MAKHLKDMTEPEIERYLSLLAAATESVMPDAANTRGKAIFAVLVFDEPGMMRWVTNGERTSVWNAIREAAQGQEVAHG